MLSSPWARGCGVLVVALGFVAGVSADQGSNPGEPDRFVTLLGGEFLVRTDTLFRGKVLSIVSLSSGSHVARLAVEETIWGEGAGSQASVVARDGEQFPEPGREVLVFAARLATQHLWECVGRFFLEDDLGKIKLAIVRRLLEIEGLPDREEKIARLRALVFENLLHEDPWVSWNAAQELTHMVFVVGVPLSPRERELVSDLTMHSEEDRFASYLQAILKDAPSPAQPEAATDDPDSLGSFIVTPLPEQAAEAVGEPARLESRSAREIARTLETSTDPQEICDALEQVANFPGGNGGRILLSATRSRSELVRAKAAFLLGRAGTPEGAQTLEWLLFHDPELRVRRNAAKSLGLLAGDAAVDALVRAGSDPTLSQDCLAALAATRSPRARRHLEEVLRALPPGPSPRRALLEDLLAG